ncbi:MAG: 50S ribosomal protein L3 N(5)-glutamine methyltransferase [Proteobacteria bacterium]|nr:50S ribosomal protein L3 N(5)-glutamine methyltransferase [Pseudomonadota bacterium]
MNKQLIAEAVNELVTLRDVLRWGMTQFRKADLYYGHGTDNAWDEALSLALHVLSLPYDMNKDLLEARLTKQEKQEIIHLFIRRIEERVPAAYLTHKAYFAGLDFYVNEHVLIPRSPLAEVIESGFAPWVEIESVERVLEIGTGSGCIAIAIAEMFPGIQVDAVDISDEALTVARKNVARYALEEQLHLIKSDVYSALNQKKYDVIITNPPYVSESEFKTLPKEYTHEPKHALLADAEGLDIVIKILRDAAEHLTEQGILIVEVGNSEETMMQRYPEIPFVWLEFERGGGGVFVLNREQLKEYQHVW